MKKFFISASIAAALGAGSFAGFRALNPAERQLSDIELANIEALAEDENDCHYINGYARWYIDAPASNSLREQFSDCCGRTVTAYSPQDHCL